MPRDEALVELAGNATVPEAIAVAAIGLTSPEGWASALHVGGRITAAAYTKVVPEQLGHASVNITSDTCSHVLPGLQGAAAAQPDSVLAKPAAESVSDL